MNIYSYNLAFILHYYEIESQDLISPLSLFLQALKCLTEFSLYSLNAYFPIKMWQIKLKNKSLTF